MKIFIFLIEQQPAINLLARTTKANHIFTKLVENVDLTPTFTKLLISQHICLNYLRILKRVFCIEIHERDDFQSFEALLTIFYNFYF